MIFRLKTSKQTQEIFEELERRTNFKPYTLVKHAIAWSVAEKTSVKDFKSDSNGLESCPIRQSIDWNGFKQTDHYRG